MKVKGNFVYMNRGQISIFKAMIDLIQNQEVLSSKRIVAFWSFVAFKMAQKIGEKGVKIDPRRPKMTRVTKTLKEMDRNWSEIDQKVPTKVAFSVVLKFIVSFKHC